MSSSADESEENKMSNGSRDMLSVEKDSSGENVVGGCLLKKGPWTTAEDAILVEYVNKHGEGNWNDVQKYSGLARCGKSCRLRWANHLRPDLKKGAITPEEERRIIELHAKMGNKWARMAVELPGRTDNEIKNYWNTRTKRLQRANLPIYPDDLCVQLNESQENENSDILPTGDVDPNNLSQTNNYDIPDIEFSYMDNIKLLPCSLPLLDDFPSYNMLKQGVGPCHQNYSYVFPTRCPLKSPWESEISFPYQSDGDNNALLALDQPMDDDWEKSLETIGMFCDPVLNSNEQFSSSVLPGSHALVNGNTSSAEPLPRVQMELPSLQYTDIQKGSRCTSASSLPSLESVDTLIQYLPTEQTQENCISPQNSGLLEAVVYQSQMLKRQKIGKCQHPASDSVVPIRAVNSLSLNQKEWETSNDQNIPFGHSAASMFSDHTPIFGNSLDEPQSVDTILGCDMKPDTINQGSTQSVGNRETIQQIDVRRPDALLDSGWFMQNDRTKDDSILTDAIGALSGDDINKIC